jgi:hypothetical protein
VKKRPSSSGGAAIHLSFEYQARVAAWLFDEDGNRIVIASSVDEFVQRASAMIAQFQDEYKVARGMKEKYAKPNKQINSSSIALFFTQPEIGDVIGGKADLSLCPTSNRCNRIVHELFGQRCPLLDPVCD